MRKWLKDARTAKNMTMKQIAAELGITESYYSLIENGDRQKTMDISLAKKLSEILSIPVEKIVAMETESGVTG
jgi:transcriptional regulator with XRE-family HTH domain